MPVSHHGKTRIPASTSTHAPGSGLDRRALAAVSVTVVAWASAFVAIRGAGRYFDPGALALGRLLAGSLVLGAVWLARGEGWPPRAAWPGIAGAGVLWFGVYMVALNWGERHVDAGTAAMIINIGPVVITVVLMSWAFLGETRGHWPTWAECCAWPAWRYRAPSLPGVPFTGPLPVRRAKAGKVGHLDTSTTDGDPRD